LIVIVCLLAAQIMPAQVVLPPGFNRPAPPVKPVPQAESPKPEPAKPEQAKPEPAKPEPAKPAPAAEAPAAGQTAGGLNLQNASLTEVISILARALKLNYILDPRVKGSVTINTYGETKAIDNRALLDTILNINNAAIVKTGDIYRIVPLTDVQRLPGVEPEVNGGSPIPDDDRIMLNLIFLKYATVDELAKLLDQFRGEFAKMWSYPPANLLLIQDTRRNMRRLMELVSLFDSDTFANQRVKLFEVKNSRPSDLAKELDGILKGISLNEKASPIKLLPVDRINTLIAVAPNPGVFDDVGEWISKLDVAVTSSAGAVENFVYRVRYGYAPTLAMAIMGLYSDNPMFAMGLMMSLAGASGGMGGGMYGGAYGAYGVQPGVTGMGGIPGMMGGMGMGYPGMGGYGGGMYGGGMYGGGMYGGGMYGGMYGAGMYGAGMYGYPGAAGARPGLPTSTAGPTAATGTQTQTDQTGTYLGAPGEAGAMQTRIPRLIPNPLDNTLLIQATRKEYEGILNVLRDIDVPPRQVLIEAKIYEVTLTGALKSGVAAYLRTLDGAGAGGAAEGLTTAFTGALAGGGVVLSAGALVGQSKRLLAAFSASELANKSRLISAPSLIATDSVPASINVGTQVPTLSAQAVTGVQEQGTSLFANNIQNRDSGVTLNVMARVNPSGIVTLTINQEVSAPIPPDPTAAIQSPSFSKRTVQTQVTLQDADTIAIGGIINESRTFSTSGIPVLHRVPVLGAAFGSRSYTNERTELVIFMTPRIIYDMNNMNEATEELKSRLRNVSRYLEE
jgi:general secretion pathway protein D